jgi:ankyrin repeat protein
MYPTGLDLIPLKDPDAEAQDCAELMHASITGDIAAVRALMSRRAETWGTDADGRTALHWAAHNGHVQVALLLLEHSTTSAKDRFGNTILHCAAGSGSHRIVQQLLKPAADLVVERGRAWLTYAKEARRMPAKFQIEKAQSAIASYAQVAVMLGETLPTDVAAAQKFIREKKDQVKKEEEAAAKDPAFWEGRMAAMEKDKVRLKDQLDRIDHLDAEAARMSDELSAPDNQGRTPLHHACQGGCDKTVGVLLAAGLDIKARAANNSTPLHVAVEHGHAHVCLTLLMKAQEAGVDIRALEDKHGRTPRDWAVRRVGRSNPHEAGATVAAKDKALLEFLIRADCPTGSAAEPWYPKVEDYRLVAKPGSNWRPRPPGAKALDSDLADVAFKRREEARKAGKRAARDAAAEELEAGKGDRRGSSENTWTRKYENLQNEEPLTLGKLVGGCYCCCTGTYCFYILMVLLMVGVSPFEVISTDISLIRSGHSPSIYAETQRGMYIWDPDPSPTERPSPEAASGDPSAR